MRLNIEIKKDVYARLKATAESEGRSISDVVRGLICDWLSDRGRLHVVPDELVEEAVRES